MNRRSLDGPGRPARFVCVEVIRHLHRQGYSFRAIASFTGVGYGTVRRAFHGLAPLGADPDAEKAARLARTGTTVAESARVKRVARAIATTGRRRMAAFG